MQETLHKHNDSLETLETASFVSDANKTKPKTEAQKPSKKSLLRNWPLMSAILVYCVFSLHDMAYAEVRYILCLGLQNMVSHFLRQFLCLPMFWLIVFFPWWDVLSAYMLFYRFSHYGPQVLELLGDWVIRVRMLVLFLQSRVSYLIFNIM